MYKRVTCVARNMIKFVKIGKQFIHLEYVQAPEHVDRLWSARFRNFLSDAGTDNDEAENLTDCTLVAWRKAEFPDTKMLGMLAERHNVLDWREQDRMEIHKLK